LESPQFAPAEDQDQDELPDEPRSDADQERFGKRVFAPKLIPEPGSDDPGEDAHRDGHRRRPDPKDFGERVLPYGFMPINLVWRPFDQRSTLDEPIRTVSCVASYWQQSPM
jgi:hypothetical protein